MIKVATFKEEDFANLSPRAVHSAELEGGMPPGLAHTFFIDEKPVAVFGGAFLNPRVFRAWALISDEVTRAPVEFFRKTRRMLLLYTAMHDLHRVEFSVRSDFATGKRFAEKLGFKSEGVMRKYGFDGADYVLYARVA